MDTINLDNEGIAVIGMSCRFPDAASLGEYWSNLCSGRVSVSFLEQEAMKKAGIPAALYNDPDYVAAAYRIQDTDKFDAAFFGYAGSEAETIDPQQRFFLECAWEAVEDAGYSPLPGGGLEEISVGVFGGSRISSYLSHVFRGLEPGAGRHAFQCLVGNDKDYLCSRVSYKLNLHGPSLCVQSACSSSLTAVHIACENLRNGACDMALAGGVAIDVPQTRGYLHQDGMIFSPDGYCRPFDKNASGTVFSGGCGVVVLRRLEDALRDADPVYAVIISSAANNDGARRVGYTAPGEYGQTMVIGEALSLSGLPARRIGYVETHGTGTAIGDPIEFAALNKVFGHFTKDRQFCALGAVKANIGHADAASGIASFIKAVKAVETGLLPPHPLFTEPNPAVDLEHSPFYINTSLCSWNEADQPRVAGISSFGIGGSNAHMIIAQAPQRSARPHPAAARKERDLFVLSSRTQDMLARQAGKTAGYLKKEEGISLQDACFTSRAAFGADRFRLCLEASSIEELAVALHDYADKGTAQGITVGEVSRDAKVSPGQKSHVVSIAAKEWLAGCSHALDGLQGMARAAGARRIHLPGTQFCKKRCWPGEKQPDPSARKSVDHAVWKSRFTTARHIVYEGFLAGRSLKRMLDHKALGKSIAPASLFAELMHAAGVLEYGTGCEISDMAVVEPLFLEEGRAVCFQLMADTSRDKDNLCALTLNASFHPESPSSWIRIARARLGEPVSLTGQHDLPDTSSLGPWQDATEHYAAMQALGMDYGPAFRGVRRVKRADSLAMTEVTGHESGWYWDPALLDCCLQGVTDSIPEALRPNGRLFVPAGFQRITLAREAGRTMTVLVRTQADSLEKDYSGDSFLVSLTMLDAGGQVVGRMEGVRMHEPVLDKAMKQPGIMQDRDSILKDCLDMDWIEEKDSPDQINGPQKKQNNLDGSWIILADDGPVACSLKERLAKDGCPCVQLGFKDRGLLKAVTEKLLAQADPLHVVLAWSLGPGLNKAGLEDAENLYARTVFPLLDIVQHAESRPQNLHLHVLTCRTFGPENKRQGADSVLAGPGQSLLWGMVSVLRSEHPSISAHVLDLGSLSTDPVFFRTLASPGRETFRALRCGRSFVPRLMPLAEKKQPQGRPVALAMDGKGLDGLHFEPLVRQAPGRGEVEVALAASSLNFRDVMMAMGIYPGEATAIGSDGAGIVTAVGEGVSGLRKGDRVALSTFGCLRSHVTLPAALAARIPDSISLEEAAGVPVAYITACWCLENLAKVRKGQVVLIHAASGGVGLAAMAVCRLHGARIFATAGSDEKRSLVREQGAELVMDSRSPAFADEVLRATNGRGADVVLNSLAGRLQDLSLGLVADGGCFAELGKSNLRPEGRLETQLGSVSYFPVDLFELSRRNPQAIADVFARVMKGLSDGSLPCLPVRTYDADNYAEAFQYMMQTRHTGKIILRWPDMAGCIAKPADDSTAGSMLISGGLGGLGLRLCQERAARGARHIVIVSRRQPDAAQQAVLDGLAQNGVQVRVAVCDVADYDAMCKSVFSCLQDMPPLAAILHLAGTLDDRTIVHLDPEAFRKVLSPKAVGAWNLHKLSLEKGMQVKAFVLFSSTAPLLGTMGQANYAAANAFLDELALYRRRLGLPALSVSWGAFSETGMAHRSSGLEFLSLLGMGTLTPEEGFARMDKLLAMGQARAVAAPVQWSRYKEIYAADSVPALLDTVIRSDEAAALNNEQDKGRNRAFASARADNGPVMPDPAEPPLASAVEKAIRSRTANILRCPEDSLDADANLMELGVDSLLALDLFQFLEKEFGIHLDRSILFSNPTVRKLSSRISAMLGTSQDEAACSQPAVMPDISPDPAARFDEFPLMGMQQAYWVGRTGALVLGNVSCHVYLETEMEHLDIARWEESWNRLINRHDMLRCVILENGSQRILEKVPHFTVAIEDATAMNEASRQAKLEEIRTRMADEVLPARQWPLFRAAVTKLPCALFRLHISLDLLIADLHSMNIMMSDLEKLYLHPEKDLPPLALTFRDYVLAQDSVRQTRLFQDDRQYWLERIRELAPAPDLPLAVAPAQITQPHFVRHSARLDRETWAVLRQKAQARELTVSGLLLACYAEILARWSSRDAFTVNVTLFNRLPMHAEVADIVGDFTSVSLLGCVRNASASFTSRAKALQKQLWADMDHSLFPGVDIIREWSRMTGSPSSDIIPIVFTSTIGFGDEHGTHPSLRTFGSIVYNITQTPQVWIDHQVRETEGCLDFNWDAVDELFPPHLVDDMFGAYCRLLSMLAADDRIWDYTRLPLLPEDQLERRMQANATALSFPDAGRNTLDDLFVRSLVRSPDALAAACGTQKISYGELGSFAEQICHNIQARGIRRGSIVAVVTDGGWEESCAALAVTSAGCAYMPVDASVPAARLKQLLSGTDQALVLTQPRHLGLDWPAGTKLMEIDGQNLKKNVDFDVERQLSRPGDLAYIIHTSGSTGTPKGVMISHQGACNTILAVNRLVCLNEQDRILALSRFTFDLSVWDMFGIFAAGGAMVLPDPVRRLEASHWLELALAHKVTMWNTVPPLMQIFADYLERSQSALPQLRCALLSGDWIPLSLPGRLRALWPDLRLISLGGATEASIWSNYFEVQKVLPQWKSIPYGRPLPNQRFYVLNRDGTDCPDNVPGELHIAGMGLADGYLKNPVRTAERFVRHPGTGEKLYATGDLGRYLGDGNIEFLGRQDNLVKINGYRVELGEVENTLLEHPKVGQAAAMAVSGRQKGMILAAFAAPRPGCPMPDAQELKNWLAERLPSFLVPAILQVRNQLPLTSSGKVDRRSLTVDPASLACPQVPAARPGTKTETLMAQVIEQVMGSGPVNIDSRFFEMGLSSLDLISAQSLLQEALHMEIPLMTLLEYTTIRDLAAWADRQQDSASRKAGKSAPQGRDTAYTRGMERARRRLANRNAR